MNIPNPKERLLGVLGKKEVDRPPVICPGGMMNAAIVEIMKKTGHTLPEAHHNGRLMAALSSDVQQYTGFENFGIPFCMTVEAETLGSRINFGTLNCEPKIAKERYSTVSEVEAADIETLLSSGRVQVITEAIAHLTEEYPTIPVVGAITGPISLAASIVEPITFFKELRKAKDNAHMVLKYVADFLAGFALLMVDSGASVIAIGDPSATGEILGPKLFEEYAVPYINRIIDTIHEKGVPVIVHICGNMNAVKNYIPAFRADAISTDAMVSLKQLKEEFPGLTTMGNISTYLLEFGDLQSVAKKAIKLADEKVDIISPACGLSTSTTMENIQALTSSIKGWRNGEG
jgi:MtaA/CmuA family methyltransferase